MATTLANLPTWVESLSPFPPTPMQAMLARSLGEALLFGLVVSAQAPRPTTQAPAVTAAAAFRTSRRGRSVERLSGELPVEGCCWLIGRVSVMKRDRRTDEEVRGRSADALVHSHTSPVGA